MGEKGRVIDEKNGGKIVVVSFIRTEACAKCRACLAGFSESEMILEAKNELGAKKGSTVMIELPDNGFFLASVIIYVFPLIAMFAGFFGGNYLARSLGQQTDLFAFGLGIALLVVSFLVIRLNENKIKSLPIFMPYVAEVSSYPDAS